jgi:hypothetical protein
MARNPAEVRGDIQLGLTGDKRAGFDPAAAPLETDAEAAGTPLRDSELLPASDAGRTKVGHAADSYQDAMRRPAGVKPPGGVTPLILIMAGWMAVLLSAVLLVAALR